MGIYFEEYSIGDEFYSPTRTITETDVVNFAAMSGDMNEIHTSETFANKTPFKRRLVHGLLGLSISHGLMFRVGLMEGAAIAFLTIDEWKFKSPIFIGDTVHAKIEVVDLIPSKSKNDRGVVKLNIKLINSDGNITQEGVKSIMIRTKENQTQ